MFLVNPAQSSISQELVAGVTVTGIIVACKQERIFGSSGIRTQILGIRQSLLGFSTADENNELLKTSCADFNLISVVLTTCSNFLFRLP